jgi:tetratricopeptide (TPR) repeat protein
MTGPLLHRDVFVCFSKARPGEAKVAFALKDQLEQLGLFAFEYEHWDWVASGVPADSTDVDRDILRHMLTTVSVVVLISPHRGQASPGVQTELEELRSCGMPVILLHWSPEGWQPWLDPPELQGLNVVWSYSGQTSGDQDVQQNACEHIATQLAVGAWLACQVRWLQAMHPRTGSRLLARIPPGPRDPLLNFRLDAGVMEPPVDGAEPDLEALAAEVASDADLNDLTAFVHDWRAGSDLMAETLREEAQFSLAQPVATFHDACEALCRSACYRSPTLQQLPGEVLHRRGLMLVRLDRSTEAIGVLESALAGATDGSRWEILQALALAQQDDDREAAILSLTRAIECAPDAETRCTLAYNRGVIRLAANGDRPGAREDFTYAADHSATSTLRHSALRARARLLTEGNDYDAAIADYTRILDDADATPRTAVSAWLDRGGLYREQGLRDEAIADWTRAIDAADATQQQRFRALEARAAAFEETGQSRQAAADYEALLAYSAIARDYRVELEGKLARLRRQPG